MVFFRRWEFAMAWLESKKNIRKCECHQSDGCTKGHCSFSSQLALDRTCMTQATSLVWLAGISPKQYKCMYMYFVLLHSAMLSCNLMLSLMGKSGRLLAKPTSPPHHTFASSGEPDFKENQQICLRTQSFLWKHIPIHSLVVSNLISKETKESLSGPNHF